jgi:hypothetical protein
MRTGAAAAELLGILEDIPMETYPVDVDPAQIVRWVMAERRIAPATLATVARRSAETEVGTEAIPIRVIANESSHGALI